jgi:hypothetical protein
VIVIIDFPDASIGAAEIEMFLDGEKLDIDHFIMLEEAN